MFKWYALYNQHGRLYETINLMPEDEPPVNAAPLTVEQVELFCENPMLLLDYVVHKDEENEGQLKIVSEPAFSVEQPPPPRPKLTALVRISDPDAADVLLDIDQLILQKSASDEPVRVTVTRPNGIPIVTVDLDEPREIAVDGRVIVYPLSGAVTTFYQRMPT